MKREQREFHLGALEIVKFTAFILSVVMIAISVAVIVAPSRTGEAIAWGLGSDGIIAGIVVGGRRFRSNGN